MSSCEPEPSVHESQAPPPDDLDSEVGPLRPVEVEGRSVASEQPLVGCLGISFQVNEDGEERSIEKESDSECDVVPFKPRRKYPYAAMFFIMAAIVGQRYKLRECAAGKLCHYIN